MDGIGGTVKRGVIAQVTDRRELIKSAKDFAATAKRSALRYMSKV